MESLVLEYAGNKSHTIFHFSNKNWQENLHFTYLFKDFILSTKYLNNVYFCIDILYICMDVYFCSKVSIIVAFWYDWYFMLSFFKLLSK